MKATRQLTLNMPPLMPDAAYALVEWLENLTHEVSVIYSDELQSEIQRLENEEEAVKKEIDELGDEFNDPIPF